MNKMRMMSALTASLIGIGLVLMQVSQAAAGKADSPPVVVESADQRFKSVHRAGCLWWCRRAR